MILFQNGIEFKKIGKPLMIDEIIQEESSIWMKIKNNSKKYITFHY